MTLLDLQNKLKDLFNQGVQAVKQDVQRAPIVQQANFIHQTLTSPQVKQAATNYANQVRANQQQPFFNNNGNNPIQWAGKVIQDVKKRGPFEGLQDLTYPVLMNPYIEPLTEPITGAVRVANYKAGRPNPLINNLLGQTDQAMRGQSYNWNQQFVRPIVNGVNKVGKTIGNAPFINTSLIKSPTNLQVAQKLGQNSPFSSFLNGKVQEIPDQIKKSLIESYGPPKQNETTQAYLDRTGGAMTGAVNFGFAKPAYAKAASYLTKVADQPTIQKIMDFVIDVQKTGGKKNYGQLGQEIQAIATDVFGQKAKDLTNKQLANAFDATLQAIGKTKNRFSLGLSTENVRGNKVNNRMGTSTPLPVHNGELSTQTLQTPEIGLNNPKNPSSLSGGSSGGSITKIPNSENPYFNTNKLNVSPQAKQQVNQVIQEVKPQIEQVVGKKLSNQEVIQTANNSAKILNSVVDRSQTQDFTARLLRTRQQLAAAAQSGKVDKAYIDNLLAIKSHGADIARKLQSFSIGADPNLITSRDAILDAVLKVEKDADKVTKAAKGVDFNDLKQATDFYRKFIKPTLAEKIDLIRYNSMLSSPNTHIINATSNLLNSGFVAPIEKTLTGTLDFLGSKLTGKPQTQFAAEGAQYAKGYWGSLHDAAHQFANSLRGKIVTGNLDVRQIPLSTSKKVSNLNLPTRLLEASDQFFTKLTQGGEMAALNYRKSKGVNVPTPEVQALDNAKYRLFRSELHTKRQGTLLNSIDDFTGLIQKARNSSNPITSTIAKFTLPFVQTPMNILKQGVEYSPAGFLTLKGAPNKIEQLSKAILGSSAAAATAILVASGRTTWAEPTDPTKKAAFRAAGMQPYAIKIGNNWVSYAKLPPAIGFPIAFISALHDAEQNKTINQNQLNVILNVAAKYGNFFADQSYVKNIGDLVSAAKGSPEAMARFVSNYPQQLIPYRALLGWMARLIDPYQRKVNTDAGFLEQQVQQLFTQIPGLSMTVPARTDKAGEPIPNQNQAQNALSPFRTTSERPLQKENYDMLQQKSLLNKNIDAAKKMILQGKNPDFTGLEQAAAAEKKPDVKSQLQAKAEESIAKQKAQLTGLVQNVGNKIIYNDNGSVKTIDLNPPTTGSGIDAYTNQNWQINKALSIYKTNLPQDQKDAAYKQLGVDSSQLEYAYKANHSENVKTQYIASKVQSMSHDELLKQLITGRVVSSAGDQFASNGVLDNLVDQGLISKQEATALKKIKTDAKGNSLVKTGTGTGKKGKIRITKVKPAKVTLTKFTKRKSPTIKLSNAKVITKPKMSKIKLTMPSAKISYKIMKPSKIKGLTNSVQLA